MTEAGVDQAAHLRRVVLGAMKSFEDAHGGIKDKDSLAKRLIGALLADLGVVDESDSDPEAGPDPMYMVLSFDQVCAQDLRGDLDERSYLWLQEPEQRNWWQQWLSGTLQDIESQLGQRKAEHERAKAESLQRQTGYPAWLEVDADYNDWRRRAVHKKRGIESRMRAIRYLRSGEFNAGVAEKRAANEADGLRMSNSQLLEELKVVLVAMEERLRGGDVQDDQAGPYRMAAVEYDRERDGQA